MSTALEQLLQGNSLLWKGREAACRQTLASGYKALDALLPGGGWPMSTIIEILVPQPGIGELRLFAPLTCHISQSQKIAWITPPFVPYAPALALHGINLANLLVLHTDSPDTLWAAEKLLRVCKLVLMWPRKLGDRELRRLKLAAAAGNSLGVLFKSDRISDSAALLRLGLSAIENGTIVEVLKARGSHARIHIEL